MEELQMSLEMFPYVPEMVGHDAVKDVLEKKRKAEETQSCTGRRNSI